MAAFFAADTGIDIAAPNNITVNTDTIIFFILISFSIIIKNNFIKNRGTSCSLIFSIRSFIINFYTCCIIEYFINISLYTCKLVLKLTL